MLWVVFRFLEKGILAKEAEQSVPLLNYEPWGGWDNCSIINSSRPLFPGVTTGKVPGRGMTQELCAHRTMGCRAAGLQPPMGVTGASKWRLPRLTRRTNHQGMAVVDLKPQSRENNGNQCNQVNWPQAVLCTSVWMLGEAGGSAVRCNLVHARPGWSSLPSWFHFAETYWESQ